MYVVKSAVAYFALVFAAGFFLGTIRVLLVVPQLGNRFAELLEMPLMLVAIVLAARWINDRADTAENSTQLGIGVMALGLLLLAEVAVGVGLRGLSLSEALLNRDPVSGTIYYIMLGVFAIMPWLVTRAQKVH